MSLRTLARLGTAVLAVLAAMAVGTAPAAAQQGTVADVSLDLTASAALLGQTITLTSVVRNAGPDASSAQGAVFFEWSRAYGLGNPTFPVGCRRDDGPTLVAVLCPLGALDPGQSRRLTVRVPVRLLTVNQELRFNSQTVFLAAAEPNPDNNYDSDSCRALTSLLVSC